MSIILNWTKRPLRADFEVGACLLTKVKDSVCTLPVPFHICHAASRPQRHPLSPKFSLQACSCQRQATLLQTGTRVHLNMCKKHQNNVTHGWT